MPSFFNRRTLDFILFELLRAEQLPQHSYYEDHSVESFGMVLDAATRIAETMMYPLLVEMDRKQPELINGQIRVNPKIRDLMARFGQDGWINAPFSYEEGGQQLPLLIHNAAAFIFQSSNYSASVFPFLTTGAANLIRRFGSPALITTYTPAMYEGRWQGTMALTEPDAGSSLSDIATTAEFTQQGYYLIKGQKIFISAGDHDACDNIVHLMLARIKGSPAGVKGISLFVVPKKRTEISGSLVANDVQTAGIFHKMGYKGAPIAHLVMGDANDCHGFLVGEPNKGLSYMFQMMNEARVGVGMNAVAIGSAAYLASLQYAKERPQGRNIADKDPTKPQVPIIQHADVKRMLLFQKAIIEGSLALLLQCSLYADIASVANDVTLRERAELLLDLLTPVAKSYPSEMCCQSTSAAMQIHGGYGYTTDFVAEQYYREARIHPIHEGTTAIHGLDLLGRKILMHNGKTLTLLIEEITATIQEAITKDSLQKLAKQLTVALKQIDIATKHLLAIAPKNTEHFLADATLYLEAFGIITIAWQWLRMAIVAQNSLSNHEEVPFYEGKILTARYFYEYELPKVGSLVQRLVSLDTVTLETLPEHL